jgi:hypothetical protein
MDIFQNVSFIEVTALNTGKSVQQLGYRLGNQGALVQFLTGQDIFFFVVSILAVGSTRPHIQWVPRAVYEGLKWQGCEADTHLHLLPKLRMMELYLHSLISLHSVVLN